MEDSGSESGSKFKVVDRRRFDSDGASKTTGPDPVAAKPKPEPKVESKRAAPEPQETPLPGEGISFASFLMSLATQAMIQMGEMAPPDGMPFSPDIEGARQTISIIEMLKAKTNGNLDAEETKLATDILHSLKLRFVRASKR